MQLTRHSSLVKDYLAMSGLTQVELAAALNVRQATVSQWASGQRHPSGAAARSLERAIAARGATGVIVPTGWRFGEVKIPDGIWEPAFAPTGRFRLPLHLTWSGTAQQRWRDAQDLPDLLAAFEQVAAVGRFQDIVTWVDPTLLGRHFEDVAWSRGYKEPWRAALIARGML